MSVEVDFVDKKEVHLRTLKQSGHVGFDSLPDQLVNKSVQNGFVFNVMCIGVYMRVNFACVRVYAAQWINRSFACIQNSGDQSNSTDF